MQYSHALNGQKDLLFDHFHHQSPFDVPIEVVQSGLVWLLSDSRFHPVKALVQGEFSSVDELRLELLSGNIKLSPIAIDQLLDEIDRLVDDYRKGAALS